MSVKGGPPGGTIVPEQEGGVGRRGGYGGAGEHYEIQMTINFCISVFIVRR